MIKNLITALAITICSYSPINKQEIIQITVKGDFNGDGKIENLTEEIRKSSSNEKVKHLNIEFEEILEIGETYTSLISSDSRFNNFPVKKNCYGYKLLENLGDLNNSGSDELGVIFNHIDYSNLNTFHIYSFEKNQWIQKKMFNISELDILEEDLHKFIFISKSGKYRIRKYLNAEYIEEDLKI
ncbi:hypothetical protein [Aureibacter tunicatorum]|uniref:Uncharacterized protein n=1 Tax=Aureibacter tunicatorum TaxID=866807 RepID=A0AAE3XMW7_9BACT|nr:hypothetical protein [Aureibacter tunicatorum]MDR6239523.1 hypothetical protein [Aureibacter tunicatorum]BDD04000.1 hypothetical protein AUTU_14830 [Aureibacter tunicatorum]